MVQKHSDSLETVSSLVSLVLLPQALLQALDKHLASTDPSHPRMTNVVAVVPEPSKLLEKGRKGC